MQLLVEVAWSLIFVLLNYFGFRRAIGSDQASERLPQSAKWKKSEPHSCFLKDAYFFNFCIL